MKETISTNAAPGAIGPYSQAIKTGDFVFCSGQLPINPADGKMPADIKAQTVQSLANVQAILNEAGMTLANIVKTTVYLADMSLFKEMNEVYGELVPAPYPARSAYAVKELPMKALVEIEVIACR
jgi:2-iminobutanoate/2-iminopropanoate deaminase